ncbi:ABC transporter permease [Phyllobacterium myrsinacearum]|uniref:Glutathione transport system permease protein GsiD n=1 Tax=Phyllobacterium myrsinacearum TaxID=28101 RepID=A0A2S9JH35_9HYPH|nr:ABC transporter permease [Phyllobacterium myrsinacearum]PRD52296.1 peptide ABC transporter permease [Phyllobacterium myrsinacearum]PWV92346.1 peptide/nickel transport system permease protein [Phyllobacterium myrsinacearum]RZS77802.1 peptide/nickel transport system permease protein [Phyllobacterium myrsinacearum]RZV04845.1 peptide/nickel transport system permease protein [Phyllobacterium myrsinacearum]
MKALHALPVIKTLASVKGSIAAAYLLLLIVGAVFAPWLSPYPYDQQDLTIMNQPPSMTHLMGTDEFGRDVLSRLITGARTSLSVSVTAISVSVLSGLILGAVCGYFGGTFDRVVMIAVDLTWSFPEILIALMLVAIIGPGLQGVVLAIAIAYLAQFTRLTRTQVMVLKGETFVEATVNLGAGHTHILFAHLLPNVLAPVLVAAMLATGDAIILEATLGFFGLGAQPPTPSWGAMMSSGTAQLFIAPWVILLPGLAVALTVIFLNLFGDAIIAALDIRTKLREA